MKLDVDQLKTTTELILSSVTTLTTKLENSMGGFNDRLTALTQQINLHDITTTEAIKNIASKLSGMKTTLDQKTNLIQNKTTAVFDKIKLFENNVVKKDVPATETKHQAVRKQTSVKTKTQNNSQDKSRKEPPRKHQKPNYHINHTQKPKPQTQNRNTDSINECIDLTKSYTRRNTIKQSTLLIGSSILKNIKTNGLNDDTAVRSISGATITTLKDKIIDLNIDKCETIILYVGGNDADHGDDLETFRENYEELIDMVAADGSRRVIVSELLPRETVDLKSYNETLKSLCADNAVEFVENYDSFLLANGQLVDSFYLKDKLHLNTVGTRKLLSNINELHQIVCTHPVNAHYRSRPAYYRSPPNDYRNRLGAHIYCHICYRKGSHSTNECWYNGRNDRLSDRVPY